MMSVKLLRELRDPLPDDAMAFKLEGEGWIVLYNVMQGTYLALMKAIAQWDDSEVSVYRCKQK